MRYPAEGVVMKSILVALLVLGCAEEEAVPCADGYERDAAGSCQVAEPGASSANGGGAAGGDNFEGDGAGECSDGIDNDGDGLTDCEDDTCEGSPDCADPDDNGDASTDADADADADADSDADADADCLLYTSPSPRDGLLSRMPSSA